MYTLCSNANSNQIIHFNVHAISVNLWQNHKISLKQATTSAVEMPGEKKCCPQLFFYTTERAWCYCGVVGLALNRLEFQEYLDKNKISQLNIHLFVAHGSVNIFLVCSSLHMQKAFFSFSRYNWCGWHMVHIIDGVLCT